MGQHWDPDGKTVHYHKTTYSEVVANLRKSEEDASVWRKSTGLLQQIELCRPRVAQLLEEEWEDKFPQATHVRVIASHGKHYRYEDRMEVRVYRVSLCSFNESGVIVHTSEVRSEILGGGWAHFPEEERTMEYGNNWVFLYKRDPQLTVEDGAKSDIFYQTP